MLLEGSAVAIFRGRASNENVIVNLYFVNMKSIEITKDKAKIIEAIRLTDDERILLAVGRLLQIEKEEIAGWHKDVLKRRIKNIDE